jgi:hypothetical protein
VKLPLKSFTAGKKHFLSQQRIQELSSFRDQAEIGGGASSAFEDKINKNVDDVIATYFGLLTQDTKVTGWSKHPDTAYTYVKRDNNDNITHSIDIRSGVISAANYTESSQVQIPEVIQGREEFKQVFGELKPPSSLIKNALAIKRAIHLHAMAVALPST